ncbi:hypothetical protein CDL15_Pgr004023 [Punica granatum]|uniref:Uncharacterized protein n=1 Tax=Punica granatum TaxID=22663 RepID=A0A218XFA0_PUNGR|nr:hypothetical protein CDL15_Pgr004023 [Punica granatum]
MARGAEEGRLTLGHGFVGMVQWTQCEASKAPVGHARAYRDILNDALAALSIIRRTRRLRTLLVKNAMTRPQRPFSSRYRRAAALVTRVGIFLPRFDQTQSDHFQNAMTRPQKGMSGVSALW